MFQPESTTEERRRQIAAATTTDPRRQPAHRAAAHREAGMSTVYTAACGDCGFTTSNAHQSYVERALRMHSCEKWRKKLAGQQRRAERMASVDRTPQPCHHKQANHQHGSRACYVLDRCRCIPCTTANSAAEGWRERQKAYGRYDKYVDAEIVREHLTKLRDYGIGLKQVSALSGVSNGSLTKIWYGLYADTGRGHERRHGEGQLVRGPARRVLRATADRILAVEAIPANLGPRQPDHERTPAARLHLRALVALGWSMSKLGRQIGWMPANFCRLLGGDSPIARGTVDKIEALYAELCMTLPPETNQRERIAASRARHYARNNGWLPPLALDDDPGHDGTTVDVDEGEYLDEAAIYRRMHGDKTVRLTKAEATEVVARCRAARWSYNDIESRTGLKPDRYKPREDIAS